MRNKPIVEIQTLIKAMEEKRWDYALEYYLWMLSDFSPHYKSSGFDLSYTCRLR